MDQAAETVVAPQPVEALTRANVPRDARRELKRSQ
jgi:hypothetical protein